MPTVSVMPTNYDVIIVTYADKETGFEASMLVQRQIN